MGTPLPEDIPTECRKAAKVIEKFIKPSSTTGPDQLIPPDIIANAKGIAILTVIKAGFLFSGRAGSGIVVARVGTTSKSWSAPSGIGTAGMGFGGLFYQTIVTCAKGQIGGEMTDFVIILNTEEAVRAFSRGGNVTLGGNLSVAAGYVSRVSLALTHTSRPVGRSAEASATAANFAAVYSYSKSKANAQFYGQNVSAADLLSGKIPAPACADALYDALDKRSNSLESLERRSPRTVAGGGSRDRVEGPSSLSGSALQAKPAPPKPGNPFTSSTAGPSQSAPSVPARTAPPIPRRPGQPSAVALYDFQAQQAGDLSFKKGDIILLDKTEGDWWSGRCKADTGIFPANYVERS
ncbi:MAG: hypothetical protein SGCHY_000033 [Lobulomycetales sp.]